MINKQSAARSTSSSKQHKTICQLRTNTTALFPVDRGKRPKQQRRRRHHSNNKARLPHRLYFSIEYSRGKEPPNDAIPGRMHATGFFRGYRLYYLLYDLCVAQLNNRNDFFPCFSCRKVFPCLLVYPPPCYKSDKKRVCNRAHQCVCSYSYLYYLHKYKLCRCARTTTPSRPGTQSLVMLLCGVFWRSNRNHYLLILVMRALAMSIHVSTFRKKFNNEMQYLPRYHGDFFTVNIICLGQNMTPIWK